LGVGQFNGIGDIYYTLTLVAMVTKIGDSTSVNEIINKTTNIIDK